MHVLDCAVQTNLYVFSLHTFREDSIQTVPCLLTFLGCVSAEGLVVYVFRIEKGLVSITFSNLHSAIVASEVKLFIKLKHLHVININ